MNDGLYLDMKEQTKFNIGYNYVENQFKIEIIVLRTITPILEDNIEVYWLTDEDFLNGKWNDYKLDKSNINTMNQIIRLTKTKLSKTNLLDEYIFYTNLDLQTTITLYLHTSVLASYDTLSNFNMDTIIKKYVFVPIIMS